jgi:hypothetical protein
MGGSGRFCSPAFMQQNPHHPICLIGASAMDKSSKIIFALIAVGLWLNVMSNLLRPAQARTSVLDALGNMMLNVQSIDHSLEALVSGDVAKCKNRRLCE